MKLQIPRQRHPAFFHEIGAAHQHRLAVDGSLHAALLAVAQLVHPHGVAALHRELPIQQRRKAAAGGLGYGGGVGHGAHALLAIDLVAVEGHRAGGKQIVVGEDDVSGASHGSCTGVPGGGRAAVLQPAGQVVQGQRPRQGQGKLDAGAGKDGQHPGEFLHGPGGEAHHAGQHHRDAQQQRQHIVLPLAGGVGAHGRAVEALQYPLLLADTGGQHGHHIGRHAVDICQMEGDAAGLRRQVKTQLTAQDQKGASGGVGRGQGAAGDDAAEAAQKIRQHRHTGAQLAAYTAVPQHPGSGLPHRQTQQRRQQQPTAQHGAAQQRGVQPSGRQYLQLL